MNITVYCGANPGNNPAYMESASEVGKWIAANGHSLVYGGGKEGLMGMVADTVLSGGGKVVGVIPDFLKDMEKAHEGVSELIVTASMFERRNIMIEKGDMFIALPGGVGTLDEISEIMSRIRLGLTEGLCILYNKQGYYDSLKEMIDKMFIENFITDYDRKHIIFIDEVSDLDKL